MQAVQATPVITQFQFEITDTLGAGVLAQHRMAGMGGCCAQQHGGDDHSGRQSVAQQQNVRLRRTMGRQNMHDEQCRYMTAHWYRRLLRSAVSVAILAIAVTAHAAVPPVGVIRGAGSDISRAAVSGLVT